jgi:hypothetical protein
VAMGRRRGEPRIAAWTGPRVYAAGSAIAAAKGARMDGASRRAGDRTRANGRHARGPCAWLDKADTGTA